MDGGYGVNDDLRPVGIALLALMTLLVALLALMLAFSLWLRGQISETYSADAILLAGLTLLGLAYGVQAYGLWRLRRWTRPWVIAVLGLATIAGLAEAARNELLAMGTMVVFGLGFVTSLVTLLALHAPSARARFER